MENEILINTVTEEDIKFKNSIIQELGLVTGTVLTELMAEYFDACMHDLNIGPHFLVNLQRLSKILNLDEDEINKALKNLLDLKLIYFCPCGINNTFMAYLQDNLEEFTEKCEQKYIPLTWDYMLSETQNPIIQKTSFCNSTNKLIQFVNKHMRKQLHIPMITYAYCDVLLKKYNVNKNFIKDKNIKTQIYCCINNCYFEPIHLPKLIINLCEQLEEKGKNNDD